MKLMNLKAAHTVTIRMGLGCFAALLVTLIAFRLHFNLSSATSLYLFLVTAIALRWGFLEAGIVSLLCVACLDYFFTEPLFAFYISDSHDWVALLTFEAAALLVSKLSTKVKLHAQASELHQERLQQLYELSQGILLLDQNAEVGQRLADLARSNLQASGVSVWNAYEPHVFRSGECKATDEEVRTTNLTEGDFQNSANQGSIRTLRLGTKPLGALFVWGHSMDAASINAAAALISVAIERAHSFVAEADAEAGRKSEQLRSAILDGLAHAFKSPLTTIRSSSSGLLAMGTLPGRERRLVALIDQQASHLADLTTHLLITAKLDRSDLKLRREEIDLEQLVRQSAEMFSPNVSGNKIRVHIQVEHSTVLADEKLLPMALLQLLDNALKYGRPGSPITIDVLDEPSEFLIAVTNQGSFIPPQEREKIFQRFYRSPGSDHRASGTGIGLSVVKRIAEAHEGRTWVVSEEHSGTTFYLTLPRTTKER